MLTENGCLNKYNVEKLKLTVDDREKTIEAERFAKGIYTCDDAKTVKRNIEKLAIVFDDTKPSNVLQNRLAKMGKWSFLTSKASNSYLQFIFTPAPENDDFNKLVEGKDEEYAQLLVQAYNMSKLDMNNLDFCNNLVVQSSKN